MIGIFLHPELLAERVQAGPEALSHCLVDHRYAHRVLFVRFANVAPEEQGNVHGFKITGGDNVVTCRRTLLSG